MELFSEVPEKGAEYHITEKAAERKIKNEREILFDPPALGSHKTGQKRKTVRKAEGPHGKADKRRLDKKGKNHAFIITRRALIKNC